MQNNILMLIIEKEENNSYDLITRRETVSNLTRLGKLSHSLDSSFYSQERSGRKNTFFLNLDCLLTLVNDISSGRGWEIKVVHILGWIDFLKGKTLPSFW